MLDDTTQGSMRKDFSDSLLHQQIDENGDKSSFGIVSGQIIAMQQAVFRIEQLIQLFQLVLLHRFNSFVIIVRNVTLTQSQICQPRSISDLADMARHHAATTPSRL
jgi:hypothetical protein